MLANQITLIVSSAVVPVFALILNVFVRSSRRAPQSTGADILLLLLAFDLTVILSANEFAPLVRSYLLRLSIIPVHIALFCLGLLVWYKAVTFLEDRVTSGFDSHANRYTNHSVFWLIGSWSIVLLLISAHILTFMYKLEP